MSEDDLLGADAIRARILGLAAALIEEVARIERADVSITERWVDIASAAAHASCSEDTIRDLVRDGRLRAGRIGRSIRVRLSELDQVLLAGGAEDQSSTSSHDARVATIVASLREPRADR